MKSRRSRKTLCTFISTVLLSCVVNAAPPVAVIPGIADQDCRPPDIEKPWLDESQTPECRALEALAVLNKQEKIHFNGAALGAPANETAAMKAARAAAESAAAKLDLPNIGRGGDGPNGIADMSALFGNKPAERSLNVTAFPTVITLAATWDRDLARRFGRALGEEFRGKGMSMALGPNINLIRSWHGGRSAETFGEDPYLISELVVPEIQAMQGQGVIAMMKHYVANNQEFGRVGFYPNLAGIDEHIGDKALQEIYFPAFKAAVQRARVGAVMCAYNKVNGEFSCNHKGLLDRLRSWGFDGNIVPDAAFAQRDAVKAARAGVDSAGPVAEIAAAIERGEVDKYFFDRKVYYTLLTRFRLGLYDHPSTGKATDNVSTAAHVALAREIASAGAVLLKNDNQVLPLQKVNSIAVIGADAGPEAVVMESGSANVRVQDLSAPIDAIRKRAGEDIKIDYERGSAGVRPLASIPASVFTPPSGSGQGLQGVYYNTPYFWSEAVTRIDPKIEFSADPGIGDAPKGLLGKRKYERGRGPWSAQWTGVLTPPASGEYALSLTGAGTAELYLDHKLVATFQRADFPTTAIGTVWLEAGRQAQVLLKYDTASALLGTGIKLGWQPPDDRLQRAVAAAHKADVAVVFAGEQLGEGHDKILFKLPGDQNRLIKAVAAANPRTVVVLHTSTAVAMPWINDVAAIVQAWYPGQEAGSSIAALLFGDTNPSGKLPVTFPRNARQGPATQWLRYPGNGQSVAYDEGVLVGYRWFDAKDQKPLFPFGHGLSYTQFRYSRLKITGEGSERKVTLNVKNTGRRAGAEVVQLYVSVPAVAQEPPRVLKGFQKVLLKPGDVVTVSMPLTDAGLAMYDESTAQWRLFPGQYQVQIGASSRDIRLRQSFMID